ncbi:phosphatase PAP2 family protein [Pseudoflavitalea sp. G-6-1-2]|uniref:phosphatase PAP2 family protein n=1 Tax=Pseudoflavitalea sp. G-6-1-2 TaxID=2728841 RepID=UPI00146EB5C1|nr:phosphatase PAP2 family protein [Pseudoflavitalea sp. G-6-1-2]NML20101.1 phosphatase PAP2 family protein [Pseudoflavitalea sp. G-6-1-2]
MPNNPNWKLFLQFTLALICPLLIVVCIYTKSTSFVAANFYHCQWLDTMFTWYTYLGDGIVVAALIIACWVMRKRSIAIKLLLSYLISGLVVQLLKEMFHAPRPRTFFAENLYSHFIEGVTHGGYASFPSGHTTTAFAAAAILACNSRKQIVAVLVFWMAVLVGYSRMYLGQHFLEDVLAGIITGIATAMIIEYGYQSFITKYKTNKRASSITYEQSAAIGL